MRALVCIGGDGSLTTADQLFENGVPVVGVPKTIDNDLSATAMSFGFDSAVQCVADALDRLHTTAASHKRVMVLEVMGRYTGWIALHGGLSGGADAILIPEIPFSYERLAAYVDKHMSGGADSTLIVAAEGACPVGGDYATVETNTPGEKRLGGIGNQVAHEIMERTGRETRTVVLGHLQRGGAPTTLDRILGTRFGVGAVQLIQESKFGHMVSYLNYQIGARLDQRGGWPAEARPARTARWSRRPRPSASASEISSGRLGTTWQPPRNFPAPPAPAPFRSPSPIDGCAGRPRNSGRGGSPP